MRELIELLELISNSQVPWMVLAVILIITGIYLGIRIARAVEAMSSHAQQTNTHLKEMRDDQVEHFNQLPERLALRLYQNNFKAMQRDGR